MNTPENTFVEEARGSPSLHNPHRQDEPRRGRPSMAGIIVCWVALIAMIACNGLFEVMRLGGVTSAEVSNQVFAWFTPAGYVFSIWGVIYASLVIWMIAMTKKGLKTQSVTMYRATLFATSCALNVLWLVAFHFQQIALSLIILAALWAVLAMLYLNMRDAGTPKLVLAPFSLYFAWSTVAVIANATNLATRIVPAPLIANQISTIVLTLAVLVVAYLSVRNSRDFVFPLVVLWATIGVGVHLMEVDMPIATAVFALSAAGAVAIYLPPIIAAVRSKERRQLDVA